MTPGHLSQEIDSSLHRDSHYIFCDPTPKYVVTSGLCIPFSGEKMGQKEAGNHLSPLGNIHVTPSRKGQAKVGSGPNPYYGRIKRAKTHAASALRLFAHLLKDSPHSADCHLEIHTLTFNDLNDLLDACQLKNWWVCPYTEDSFEARMDISFSMVATLLEITPSQFEELTIQASTSYPDT